MDRPPHPTCLDPVIDILEKMYHELPQVDHWKDFLLDWLLDLRFLKMFLWALKNRNDDDTEEDLSLCLEVIRIMVVELTAALMRNGAQSLKDGDVLNLVLRIKLLKPQIGGICIHILGGEFKRPSPNYDKFGDYVQESVDFLKFSLRNVAFLSLVADRNSPVKKQIRSIVEIIQLIADFVDVALGSMVGRKSFEDFLSFTQTWATHISWIACIHWTNGANEDMAGIVGNLLLDLMQKTMLMWFQLNLLKAAGHGQLSIHQLHQFDATYVDFLLKNLDGVEVLRQKLTFLISYVGNMPLELSVQILNKSDAMSDPPVEDSWLIWTEIHAIISEVPSVICSVYSGETADGSSTSKSRLSDFLEKIDRLEAGIRDLHVLMPSESSFPKTNAIGFLDFLLTNVKHVLEGNGIFNPRLKFQLELVLEELESLRSCLHHVMKLHNEDEEKNKLWKRIISAVYTANYAVKLSSLMDVPVWYTSISLSNVIEDMKLIKIEVKRIEDDEVYNSKKLDAKLPLQLSDPLPQQSSISRVEGVFIGFEDDARSVIDHLVGGQRGLKIISISGMPGQGKTTLARRIYHDPEIQYHFHRTAWCYVSKECKTKDLLVGVLRDLGKADLGENLKNLETQDLLEHLWRSLKGRRYMIVMDDIWDVETWRELQGSFPDDSNGSRILFTSRNHNLASQAKNYSISHPLRLFSEEESWQLMEKKLLQVFPPELVPVAKQVAIYCKGLPLAISLMASVLGKTGQQIDLWKKVAENLKSHLANEGCAHIIELSYRYLPEHLKPCFLYFLTFPRGKFIRARKLKLLWIAEGFVQENEVQRAEDLANEHLEDLVSQSLVIVRQRGSNGGIKTCTVHDLLYDLCLEKVVEENFLQYTEEFIYQRSPTPRTCDHYRLCIRSTILLSHIRPACDPKKLLVSQVHSLRCFDHYFLCSVDVADLASFKILTVLDLEYVPWRGSFFNIPEALFSFVHLRYLAMDAAIQEIPPSIVRLWNLETLIIKGAKGVVMLPRVMFKMENLMHVILHGSYVIFADSAPEEASTVCNIERFVSPIVYYNPDSKKLLSLRRFQKLRKLRCCFSEHLHPKHAKYWRSIFRPLTKLESLRIDYELHEPWFTAGRKCRNFVGFDFPETLKKLTLAGLKLPWSAVSTFGKMPNLEVLKLEEEACAGLKWDLEDQEFPRLRYLKMCELDIEHIDVSGCDDANPFPCLEEFVVDGCERLEEIPSSFGDICTLKAITVAGWFSLKSKDSAMRILKEQRDMGNDELQVCIIHGGRNDDDDDGTDLGKATEKRFKRQVGFFNALLCRGRHLEGR